MPAPTITAQSSREVLNSEPEVHAFDPNGGKSFFLLYTGENGDPWNVCENPSYGGLALDTTTYKYSQDSRRIIFMHNLDVSERSNNNLRTCFGFTKHWGIWLATEQAEVIDNGMAQEGTYSSTRIGPTIDPQGKDCLCLIVALSNFDASDALTKYSTFAVHGTTPTLLAEGTKNWVGSGASFRMWSVPLLAADGPAQIGAQFNWPTNGNMVAVLALAGVGGKRLSMPIIVS